MEGEAGLYARLDVDALSEELIVVSVDSEDVVWGKVVSMHHATEEGMRVHFQREIVKVC